VLSLPGCTGSSWTLGTTVPNLLRAGHGGS